jgi:hypothetical protein
MTEQQAPEEGGNTAAERLDRAECRHGDERDQDAVLDHPLRGHSRDFCRVDESPTQLLATWSSTSAFGHPPLTTRRDLDGRSLDG